MWQFVDCRIFCYWNTSYWYVERNVNLYPMIRSVWKLPPELRKLMKSPIRKRNNVFLNTWIQTTRETLKVIQDFVSLWLVNNNVMDYLIPDKFEIGLLKRLRKRENPTMKRKIPITQSRGRIPSQEEDLKIHQDLEESPS